MPRSPGSEPGAPALTAALARRPSVRLGGRVPQLMLLAAAVLSAGLMGAVPAEGFQLPLAAVMAALVPLQLAALFYVFRRPRKAGLVSERLNPPAQG